MQLYTVAQIREAEQRAASEYGIPLADLMDNAGKRLGGRRAGNAPTAGRHDRDFLRQRQQRRRRLCLCG